MPRKNAPHATEALSLFINSMLLVLFVADHENIKVVDITAGLFL
jgi:hypothetical protein